jgi:hypothetical protein
MKEVTSMKRYRRRLNPKLVDFIKYTVLAGIVIAEAWLFAAMFC